MHGTCGGRGRLLRTGSAGAIDKLPGGDFEVTITGLHYDTGAAGPVPALAPEGRAR